MSYLTILEETVEKTEEKKSIFIGHALKVTNAEEAQVFLQRVRQKHNDATHNTYAYVIGENMHTQKYSDDGEPKGTAGIPIINVIKMKNITDVAVVVTRYFGGILLGGGGLVRAYSKAAAAVLEKASIVEVVKGRVIYFTIDYEFLGKIQYLCSQNNWHIEDIEYTHQIVLKIYCMLDEMKEIKSKLIEATNASINFSYGDCCDFFKKEKRLIPIIPMGTVTYCTEEQTNI